jgi:HAD superfamily hydrolase (TIGR01549 family)
MTTSDAGVLFDVDGTLCDTNYLHSVAWARAFAECGVYAHTSTLHSRIGMGSDQLLQDLIGRDDETISDAHGKHFEAFLDDIRAFPGSADLLRAVARLGARVVLASSAKPDTLERMRKVIGADDVIDESTSSGEVDSSKPSPDIFQTAMSKAGLDPKRCMVVGDTVWDVKAARKAGLDCICVLTGGIGEAELMEAGAVAVYKDPHDLLDRLEESPLSALFASG